MSPPLPSPDRAVEEEEAHTPPATFLEWTTYNAIEYEGEPEMTEVAFLQDIKYYTTYLREGPFHPHYLTSFTQQVSQLHSSDEANFDFLPDPYLLVPGYRNWMAWIWSNNDAEFLEDVEYMMPEATQHQRFNRSIAMYAQYLADCGAFMDLEALLTSRNWLAENNRRELNNLHRMDHTYGEEGEWIPLLRHADMLEFDTSANESSLSDYQSSTQSSGEASFEGKNLTIDQGLTLSFAEWAAANTQHLNSNLSSIPHSMAAILELDVCSYQTYLIGRPEYDEFEASIEDVRISRLEYDFVPPEPYPTFEGFCANLVYRFSHFEVEHGLCEYATHLQQLRAPAEVLMELANQRDKWAYEERRLFSGLTRLHPVQILIDDIVDGFDRLSDNSARFSPRRQERMRNTVQPAISILVVARANWNPQLGGSILTREELDTIRLTYQRVCQYRADDLGAEADYRQLLRDYNEYFIENQIHPERLARMQEPESESESESDSQEEDEGREEAPIIPDIPSLPQEPWFHPLEIQELIQDVIREAIEEEERMNESSEDEDDRERQGRRIWRGARPIRRRGRYLD